MSETRHINPCQAPSQVGDNDMFRETNLTRKIKFRTWIFQDTKAFQFIQKTLQAADNHILRGIG